MINRTSRECQSPGGASIRYAALGLREAGDRPGGRQAGTEIREPHSQGGPGLKAGLTRGESLCLFKRARARSRPDVCKQTHVYWQT